MAESKAGKPDIRSMFGHLFFNLSKTCVYAGCSHSKQVKNAIIPYTKFYFLNTLIGNLKNASSNIAAKKFLYVFFSIVLAFSLCCPCAYANDNATISLDSSLGFENSRAAAVVTSDISIQSPDSKSAEGESEGNAEYNSNPELPSEQDPDPDPNPKPQGPLTFSFNISSRPVIQDIEQISTGLRIIWSPVSDADGYVVLRRKEGTGLSVDEKYEKGLSKNSITLDAKLYKKSALAKTGWACYATITSPKTISWVDKKASYGRMYEYSVLAYKTNKDTSNASVGFPYLPSYVQGRDISRPSSSEIGYRMSSPTLLSINRNARTMTIRWASVAGADGYTVQLSRNSAFSGKSTKTVKGKSSTSVKFKGLSKSINYCVRIRAYGNVFSGISHSMWNTSYFTNALKRASMSRLMYKYKVKKEEPNKKNSSKTAVKGVSTKNLKKAKKTKNKIKYITKTKPFELRVQAGQKMGRYDTMQGGCSDGKYMYFVLLNKIKNRCKIAKVRIKTKKVVKVSMPLKLNHGNGLAYNSDTKRLVVAHAEGSRYALTEINKNSLKMIRTHYVYAPSTLPGATQSQLKNYKGFGSIAYSPKEDVYVGLLYKSHNIVFLDSDFRLIKYVKLSKKKGQIYQCVEVAGDNILIGESFGTTRAKSYNILSTYNWDGSYVTTTRLQKSYELENVFVAGTTVYAGFYRCYSKGGRLLKDNYVYRINTF